MKHKISLLSIVLGLLLVFSLALAACSPTAPAEQVEPVSYTHLDVYKRQQLHRLGQHPPRLIHFELGE